MAKTFIYTTEVEQFIAENQKGITRQQLADMLNAKFGGNFTAQGVKSYCYRKRVSNGLSTKFAKGQEPIFKGKVGYFKNRQNFVPNSGSYQKGNRPYNEQLVGYEYISKQGYIIVKTGHRRYEHKQRLVWRQQNGDIPKNYCIKFIDNNPLNCTIENLICIPNGAMRAIGRQLTDDVELNKAIILTETLRYQMKKGGNRCQI